MATVRIMFAGLGFGVLGAMLGIIVLAVSLIVHPLAAVVMLAGLPVLYFFLRFPVWGVALTVAAIPLEGLGRFTASDAAVIVSVAKLFGLMAALALTVNLTLGRVRAPWHPEVACLIIFCLVGVITMGYTTDLDNGLPRVVSFITTGVFFYVIIAAIRDIDDIRLILIGLLIATAAVGVFAIAQRALPGFAILNTDDTAVDAIGVQVDLSEQSTLGGEIRRSGGTSGSPHVYAANLLVAIPLYFYFMRTSTDWRWRMLAFGGLMLAVANLLLTHTRSGVITCLPIFGLMLWRGLITINARGVLMGVLAAAVMFSFLPESVTVRLLDLERYSVDGAATLSTRFDYWRAGAEMLRENWLFGMGMGNFSDLAHYEPSVTLGHAFMHNIYLQLFNEVGIFGFGALMTFLALTLYRSEKSYRNARRHGDPNRALMAVALQASFLSGLVLGGTMDYLHFAVKDWWFIVASILAMHVISAKTDPNHK
ncbi:MAG: O-antigen ligase family protein [Paracoccaceae bacterium]